MVFIVFKNTLIVCCRMPSGYYPLSQ